MRKIKLANIGLLQALSVVIYCYFIAGFFQVMAAANVQPPQFLVAGFMLTLLVFSVAIIGSLIFGYPVILALNKKVKQALKLVSYTLLYLFGFSLLLLIILLI